MGGEFEALRDRDRLPVFLGRSEDVDDPEDDEELDDLEADFPLVLLGDLDTERLVLRFLEADEFETLRLLLRLRLFDAFRPLARVNNFSWTLVSF